MDDRGCPHHFSFGFQMVVKLNGIRNLPSLARFHMSLFDTNNHGLVCHWTLYLYIYKYTPNKHAILRQNVVAF